MGFIYGKWETGKQKTTYQKRSCIWDERTEIVHDCEKTKVTETYKIQGVVERHDRQRS